MRKIRFFAIFASVLVLFNALPFVAYATEQHNITTEQNIELKEADIPAALSLSQVQERGHTKRLHSKEDLNTAVFQNQDGTETLYMFDENIKYRDKTGQSFDKSNKLTKESDGSFRNRSNDVSVTYPEKISDGVSVEYEGFFLKLVPVSSTNSHGDRHQNSDTQISYQNVFGNGTNLLYTQTFSGFKEDIILYTSPTKNTFEFWVYTNSTLLKDSTGRVAAYNDNEKIGEFGDIVIYDSNDVYAFGTTELEYVKEGVYKLTVNVPAEYLADESRVYPVTVDPTFTISTSSSNENIIDATLYSDYSDCFSDYFTMFVGNYDLWASSSTYYRGTARSVISFPGLYSNTTFQNYYNTDRITSVELMLTVYRAPVAISVKAHHMMTSWTESNVETKKSSLWSATSSYTSPTVNIAACDYGVNPVYAFNITNIVMTQMADTTMPRHGVMLKATDETKQAVCFNTSESGDSIGVSSSKPYLRITYTSLPTTETTGIVSGGTYQIVNAANSAALEYRNAGISTYSFSAGNSAQLFTITYDSAGRYFITQPTSGNRLAANGDYVGLATASTSSSQKWYIVPSANGYRLINALYTTKQINIPTSGTAGLSNSVTNAVWKIQRVLNVPLDMQDTPNTCNVASAKMVLHYYGYTDVTEEMLIASAGENYGVVYHLTIGLNYYLDFYESQITYEYEYVTACSQQQYQDIIINEIINGHPVIALLKITDSTYFPYTTNGHYVVIVGIYYDMATSQYMFVVNDPHNEHCGQYVVPASSMYTYTMVHSSGGIVIHKS